MEPITNVWGEHKTIVNLLGATLIFSLQKRGGETSNSSCLGTAVSANYPGGQEGLVLQE